MSSIWTPGGEHRVPGPDQQGPAAAAEDGFDDRSADGLAPDDLSPEEQARLTEAADELAVIRAQLAAAPPEQVVANHLIGLYELAAIHLGRETPNLPGAKLAIDALGAVLDACKGRLGEAEPTLGAARSQIQLAFVSVSGRAGTPPGDTPAGGGPAGDASNG